jgi:hypothetical protein
VECRAPSLEPIEIGAAGCIALPIDNNPNKTFDGDYVVWHNFRNHTRGAGTPRFKTLSRTALGNVSAKFSQ